MAFTDQYTILDQATGTTTSEPFDVSMRQLRSLHCFVTGFSGVGGVGTVTVDVSNDKTNWVIYNRLIPNLSKSSTQTDQGTTAITLTSVGTSVIAFFPVGDYFKYIRANLTVGTTAVWSANLATYSSTN